MSSQDKLSGREIVDVLLLNLGTPDELSVGAVRRYLREFLMDGRVIELPRILRWILVYLIIAPFRGPKSLHGYKKVWLREGSPLRVYSDRLVAQMQQSLGSGFRVRLAMRYQSPSLKAELQNLVEAGSRRLVVVPLFPQYATASTGSALAKVYEELSVFWNTPSITVVPPFYDDPDFIKLWASRLREAVATRKYDAILLTYHGLPEAHIRKSYRERCQSSSTTPCLAKDYSCCDVQTAANAYCYRAHCMATSRALIAASGVDPKICVSAFQSRLTQKWIRPFSDEWLLQAPSKGLKNVLVVSPSFVADCLETTEEIGIRALEDFKKAGGESLVLLPSLNDSPDFAEYLANRARAAASGMGALS